MQQELGMLIFDYENVINDRVTMIGEMITELKNISNSQEDRLAAEEDIMRVKSQIDLASRDNSQKD